MPFCAMLNVRSEQMAVLRAGARQQFVVRLARFIAAKHYSANVRFRDDGQMILIDFSENPGVHGACDESPALIKDFAGQFANHNRKLYQQLIAQIPQDFRERMASALTPWER